MMCSPHHTQSHHHQNISSPGNCFSPPGGSSLPPLSSSETEDYLLSFHYLRDASMFCTRERGDHMADVLLSLKHAVVHPHQVMPLEDHSPSLTPLTTVEENLKTQSIPDNCSFLTVFQSSPHSLDLPSSVLGDSFEDTLIGGTKDSSSFNIESLVSPCSSPPTFTQLTSSPSQIPMNFCNFPSASSCIDTPLTSSDSTGVFNETTTSLELCSSLLSPVAQKIPSPPRSSSPSAFHSTATILQPKPHASAFTPVVPLPSFVHPRNFIDSQTAEPVEHDFNSEFDNFSESYSYLIQNDSTGQSVDNLLDYPERYNQDVQNSEFCCVPQTNDGSTPSLTYTISVGGQPLSSYEHTSEDVQFESFNQTTATNPDTTTDSTAASVSNLAEGINFVENSEPTISFSNSHLENCDEGLQNMGPNCGSYTTPAGYQDPCYPNHHGATTHVFPAMSVNVSMNMTMGVPNVNMGYGPDPCIQSQWNNCQQVNPMSPMSAMGYQNPSVNQGMVSPLPVGYSSCNQSYGVGAYTWASEFRNASEQNTIHNFEKESCLKSPTVRPRPSTPPGAYFNPIHPGAPSSPGLGCIRRRPCSGPPQVDMTKAFLSEGMKTNLCRICGKTYARPSTLKTHLRTHSGEKPYRCNQCDKSFSQAANLTAHVRTHSGEKPFRCGICDRKFSQSSSVTTHMRTHSGDRPYRCKMCRKAFSDSSTLTKHLRIHSGEKPYQCKLCLLRFSQSGNLNRHMRVHSQTS